MKKIIWLGNQLCQLSMLPSSLITNVTQTCVQLDTCCMMSCAVNSGHERSHQTNGRNGVSFTESDHWERKMASHPRWGTGCCPPTNQSRWCQPNRLVRWDISGKIYKYKNIRIRIHKFKWCQPNKVKRGPSYVGYLHLQSGTQSQRQM